MYKRQILPSALELVGGWALYKIYHTRWWDYSDFPFNIGGYICLEFCLLWGVGTLVVMRIVHPVVADLVDLIPPFVGVILMCFLYAVYAADVVATAIAASALADTLDTMEQLGVRPEDTLFCGDTLFAGSCGRTDLPGGDPMEMLASLRRLGRLEGDYTVYPGHMDSTTLAREKQYNPFIRQALR